MRTSTPCGTAIGILPTRDIASPHVAQYLAAQSLAASFFARHYALRRRKYRDSQSAVHSRHLPAPHVDTQPGLTYALKAHDHRLAFFRVGHLEPQRALDALGSHVKVADVAFLLERCRQSDFDLGGRHVREVVLHHQRIADS